MEMSLKTMGRSAIRPKTQSSRHPSSTICLKKYNFRENLESSQNY